MPIYEYQCPKCHTIFEEWVKVQDAHSEEACPKCGTKSQRLISHTSFVLKGGGWYVTDYGYRKGVKEDQGKTLEGNSKDSAKESSSTTDQKTKSTSAEPKPMTDQTPSSTPKSKTTTAQAS